VLRYHGGCYFTRITTRHGPLLDQFRETKIKNLRVTLTRNHDVVGFEIAMNNSRAVSFCQTFGYVLQIAQEL